MDEKEQSCGNKCHGKNFIVAPAWLPPLMIILLIAGFYVVAVAMAPAAKTASAPTISPVNIYSNGSAAAEHKTVTASGTATQKVDPDMLTIIFYVDTDATTANAAQTKNAEVSNNIVAALKTMGVQDKDIKTNSYSVNVKQEGHYICKNGTASDYKSTSDCYYTTTNIGYTVDHSFSVDVYNLNNGGSIADAISSRNGSVSSIYFGLTPATRSALNLQLLSKATTDAKAQAGSIASAAGMTLSAPLSLSSSYYSPQPVYYSSKYMDMAAPGEAGTNLQGGTIDVSATVNAVFEMN